MHVGKEDRSSFMHTRTPTQLERVCFLLLEYMSKCNLYLRYKWDILSHQSGPSVEANCTCINAKSHAVHKDFLSGASEGYFSAPFCSRQHQSCMRNSCSYVPSCPSAIDMFQHRILVVHFWHSCFNFGARQKWMHHHLCDPSILHCIPALNSRILSGLLFSRLNKPSSASLLL